MRILSRYILKEVFSHSLLGLLILSFVIFIPHVSRLLAMVVEHNLSGSDTALLFLLPLPGIVILTIPMAVLVGILIGLSRMAADGEVVAARAAGIGIGQFARPVMLFALLGWGAASAMSVYLAPLATRTLDSMETRLAASQAPYEIQPRVFIEQFKNLLIYLEDVTGSRSRWRGVFIADTSQHGAPKITLAESGILVNDPQRDRLVLHLEHGTTHEADLEHPERYSVISFSDTDIPIPLQPAGSVAASKHSPEMMSMGDLLAASRHAPSHPERLAARVQLHYRLALPFASLVLALVGMPLGLFTRKGGKALGLLAAILLVFTYYMIMAFGLSFAKQGRIPAALGLWLANGVFALAGLAMILQLRRVRVRIHLLLEWFEDLGRRWRRRQERAPRRPRAQEPTPHPALRPSRYRFFQILDVYIIRSWLLYFALLLVTFCGIYVIFDFFQLLGDIVRNHVAFTVVVDYYRFLLPQVIFLMLPLSILVATLVSFGLLTKTHQVTAIKSAGISLYRIAAPVLLAAFLASVGMFVLEDAYLPATNQRQDALRNQIKGKPAQTYYRPDRQWIFGESNDIYNYRFFDADQNVFANLSVFEFNPQTFTMTRRIYAARAFWEPPLQSWVLERGWVRNLQGDQVARYTPFTMRSFPELKEPPGYFKKEVKPSAQMSVLELRGYINELTQSGFDVVRLSVQFYRKFSFPLMAFVVALIGIPFSFSMGSKGALAGIALSIGIAILYWSTSSLFEAMGNLNQLPAVVAAWSPDVLFGLGGVYLFLRVKT
jgi:lipopolysaccharide export system permease protein